MRHEAWGGGGGEAKFCDNVGFAIPNEQQCKIKVYFDTSRSAYRSSRI